VARATGDDIAWRVPQETSRAAGDDIACRVPQEMTQDLPELHRYYLLFSFHMFVSLGSF
jgi:hypothetical protein